MAQAKAGPGPTSRRRAARAAFTPRFDHGAVADADERGAALDTRSAQVVDARPAERFRGEAPEPRPGLRSGHMPGSLNVPSSEARRRRTLRRPAEIRAAFADAGVDVDKPDRHELRIGRIRGHSVPGA